MLIAKTKQGREITAADAVKAQEYYCGGCGRSVILKKGVQKEAHFAHKAAQDCQLFSELETIEHIALKKFFYKWLGKPAILEAYLPKLKQRPDILQPEHKLALELQCSSLSLERLKERVNTYVTAHYENWWILGMRFLKNSSFSQLEKSCCMYTKHRGIHLWQADVKAGKLHLLHHITEIPLFKIRYCQSTWAFFETDLLTLKKQPILKYDAQNVNRTNYFHEVNYYRWIKEQLRRKQKRILFLQEQCYLRKKHILYLTKWIYSNSRYFFFYQENLFYYRLVFEETFRSVKAVHYKIWRKEIKKQNLVWHFPLIAEEQIMKELFEECSFLFTKTKSTKILNTQLLN